jgi:myosin heavy subunit
VKEQFAFDDLLPLGFDCCPPSPSNFKSLVSNLRRKLCDDVATPADSAENDSLLQQTMDDVACLSRLLRISEAGLIEERNSSQKAQTLIEDLQRQLQEVSTDASKDRSIACELRLELQRCQERFAELERDSNTLRDALCKSEFYRKEYAKSKKSELLDMQAKLDASTAECSLQASAHQRTRELLLSEVETRSELVHRMQQLEASFSELQKQHQKQQELCRSQEKQLQVCARAVGHCAGELGFSNVIPRGNSLASCSFARMQRRMSTFTETKMQNCNGSFMQHRLPLYLRHKKQPRLPRSRSSFKNRHVMPTICFQS